MELGPFEGCRACDNRCEYRFEVQASVSLNNRREIREAIMTADTLQQAVDICWRLSERVIFHADVLNRRGLSLCIAVHQGAGLSLRSPVQRERASEFVEILANKGSGHNEWRS